MVIKNPEFYADFQSVEKMARNHTGKVINDKTFIRFWPISFLNKFLAIFFSGFDISIKYSVFYINFAFFFKQNLQAN